MIHYFQTPLETAQAAKNTGNKYFKAGRFEKAIELYTKALEHCPKDNVAEISTFHQNRAAAFEQMVGKLIILKINRKSDCSTCLEMFALSVFKCLIALLIPTLQQLYRHMNNLQGHA